MHHYSSLVGAVFNRAQLNLRAYLGVALRLSYLTRTAEALQDN